MTFCAVFDPNTITFCQWEILGINIHNLYIIDEVLYVCPLQNFEDRPEGPFIGPGASRRLHPSMCWPMAGLHGSIYNFRIYAGFLPFTYFELLRN